MLKMKKIKGFTLIELLIVVAIIAVLAGIAVPNYLSAQARSKVARTKSDLQNLATALESYYVDNNSYPRCWNWNLFPTSPNSVRLIRLTTPVAYFSKVPKPDPFGPVNNPLHIYDTYDYSDEQSVFDLFQSLNDPNGFKQSWGGFTWGRAWRISGAGPDKMQDSASSFNGASYPSPGWPCYYDPTNGTTSMGDIIRFGSLSGKYGDFGDALMGPVDNF